MNGITALEDTRNRQPHYKQSAIIFLLLSIIFIVIGLSIVIQDLFGLEKDESFKGSIGNIYQSFAGEEIYPSLEEKAANLLYFVTKNHSFADGNKRIAATMFLYFLDKKSRCIHTADCMQQRC